MSDYKEREVRQIFFNPIKNSIHQMLLEVLDSHPNKSELIRKALFEYIVQNRLYDPKYSQLILTSIVDHSLPVIPFDPEKNIARNSRRKLKKETKPTRSKDVKLPSDEEVFEPGWESKTSIAEDEVFDPTDQNNNYVSNDDEDKGFKF